MTTERKFRHAVAQPANGKDAIIEEISKATEAKIKHRSGRRLRQKRRKSGASEVDATANLRITPGMATNLHNAASVVDVVAPVNASVKMNWIAWTLEPRLNQLKAVTGTKIHGRDGAGVDAQKNQATPRETATTTGLSNANARIAPTGMNKTMILDRKSDLNNGKTHRMRKEHAHVLDGVDDVVEAEAANEGKTETQKQLFRQIPTTTL